MAVQQSTLALSLASTALATSYTAGAAVQPGRTKGRLRFYVKNVRSSGSGATTTTVKLQLRFNDGTTTTVYQDLPSTKEDASGTLEVEHAFTSTANTTTSGTFYLENSGGLMDVTVNLKVNATGQAGDQTDVWMVATQ